MNLINEGEFNLEAFELVSDIFIRQIEGKTISVLEAHEILVNFSNRSDLYLYFNDIIIKGTNDNSKFIFLSIFEKFVHKNWEIIPEKNKNQIHDVLFSYLFEYLNNNYNEKMVNQASKVLIEIYKYDYCENCDANDFYEIAKTSGRCCIKFLYVFMKEIIENCEGNEDEICYKIMNSMNEEIPRFLEFLNNMIMTFCKTELLNDILSVVSLFFKWVDPVKVFQSTIMDTLVNLLESVDFVMPIMLGFTEFISSLQYISGFESNIVKLLNLVITFYSKYQNENEELIPDEYLISFLTAIETCVTSFPSLFNTFEEFHELMSVLHFIVNVMNIYDETVIIELCCSIWISVIQNFNSDKDKIAMFYPNMRRLLILRMPKPYHFDIVIDEFGNEIKKYHGFSENDSFLSIYRNLLINISSIDPNDTIEIIYENLDNFDDLIHIFWAFGVISHVIPNEIQKQNYDNINQVIFSLLNNLSSECLCGVAYFFSYQSSFLSETYCKLEFIIETLVKFILNGTEELKYVSLFGLKKISQVCAKSFVDIQNEREKSLLEQMIDIIPEFIQLADIEILVEYIKCCTFLIRTVNNDKKDLYLEKIFNLINVIIEDTPFDINSPNSCFAFIAFTKCNSSIASSLPIAYFKYLQQLLPSIVETFNNISKFIPQIIEQNEQQSLLLRAVKSSIILLLYHFCFHCFKPEPIINFIIPNTFELLFHDYIDNPPKTRVSISLKYFTIIFSKKINGFYDIKEFFLSIFNSTLCILTDYNFSEYWYDFYNLIYIYISSYGSELSTFQLSSIDLIINTIKYGMESPEAKVYELCFNLMKKLISSLKENMSQEDFSAFYKQYGKSLFEFSFQLLGNLKYKFTYNNLILLIQSLLSYDYFQQHPDVAYDLICKNYPSLSPDQTREILKKIINCNSSIDMKVVLYNFLSSIRKNIVYDPKVYSIQKEINKSRILNSFAQISGLENYKDMNEITERLTENLSQLSISKSENCS